MDTLVGIFAYNEGQNLPAIVRQVVEQIGNESYRVIVMDDSSDPGSIELAQSCASVSRNVQVMHSSVRVGRIGRGNELATIFAREGFKYLLHFNSDVVLSTRCVPALLNRLRSGIDLVSGVSVSLEPRCLFEKGVRAMVRASELERLSSDSNAVLTGHFAGYSALAVTSIFPLPIDGSAEDLVALSRAVRLRLSREVVREAIAYYRLPGNLGDFLAAYRRVSRMTDAARSESDEVTERILKELYRTPNPNSVARAVLEAPLASALVPLLFLARVAARATPEKSVGQLWEPQESTKRLMTYK